MLNIFYEYYDIDITHMLFELLNKNEPIKLDSDYLDDDDVDETNIWKYSKDPTLIELKSDMQKFCEDICKEINKIQGVDSATITTSQSVGMSTYITIHFTKPPKDSKLNVDYLNGYSGEYTLKLRLSNHKVSKATDADILIDLLGKKFNQFEKEVLDIVKQRVEQLNNYYRDFKRTKKISSSQKQRNKERKQRKQEYKNVVSQKNKYKKSNKTESLELFNLSDDTDIDYITDQITDLLYDETLNYLRSANIEVIDILRLVFDYLDLDDYLVELTVKCLNKYVLDYSAFDTFDVTAFLNDLDDLIDI